jgi:hypothetical protein
MKMLCKVRLSEHKYKTPEGYLYCKDAIIARTGKQTYLESEIFEGSTSDDYVEVDRREEEVFSPETMASFENKPLTIEHPNTSVGPENYKDLSVGHVQNVRKGEYEGQPVMLADIVVNDAEAIRLIESGEMVELSCGYDCDITDGPNPEQVNIRGNHVALCEAGRAGIAMIVDSKKKTKDWVTSVQDDDFSRLDFLMKDMTWTALNNDEIDEDHLEEWADVLYNRLVNRFNRQLTKAEKTYFRNNVDKIYFEKKAGYDKLMSQDIHDSKSLQDSVSKGTLIQEFGKQGKQYKISKIVNNVIYAESLETGKTILFKKDEENIEWAVITKSEVKDSRIKDEYQYDLDLAKDIYNRLKEGANADLPKNIRREIENINGVVESMTVRPEHITVYWHLNDFTAKNEIYLKPEIFDNRVWMLAEDIAHAVWKNQNIKDSKVKDEMSAYEYNQSQSKKILETYKDLVYEKDGFKLYSSDIDNKDILTLSGSLHHFVIMYNDKLLGGFQSTVENAKKRVDEYSENFNSINEKYKETYNKDLTDDSKVKDEETIDINECTDIYGFTQEEFNNIWKKINESSKTDAIGNNSDRKMKRFVNYDEAKKFFNSIPKDLEPAMDEFDYNEKVGKDIRWLEYWEVYYWDKKPIRDSNPYIIELEDKKSWLDINDKPTSDKTKARKFNSKEEAESHMNTYCKGTVCEFVEDTFIEDEETKKHTCCICGKEFEGWGNNPWPIKQDGECCDECNQNKVIPARLKTAGCKDSLSVNKEGREIEELLKNVNFDNISESWGSLTIDFSDKKELKKAAKILVDKYDIELFDDELYIAVYDKFDSPKEITLDSKDTWLGIDLIRGEQSKEFKEYLKDRGLYFEPSSNGDFIHFEIKNGDEFVKQRADDIRRHYANVKDGYSRKFYSKMIKELQDQLDKLEKNEMLDENNHIYEKQKNRMKESLKKQIEEYQEKLKNA